MSDPGLRASYQEMMEYAYHTARRDAVIIDAWNEGVPAPRIAEIMGMGKTTVYRVLRAAGIKIGDDK